MEKPLYLVGMMGSGKSAIARMLAERFGCSAIDLDQCIVDDQGCEISTLFAEKGEAYFREVESRILRDAVPHQCCVVATGGGIVINDANIEHMKKAGRVVYLQSPIDELFARIAGDSRRPLLKDPDPKGKLESLFAARKEQYEKADYCVDTTGCGLSAVADKICALLGTDH